MALACEGAIEYRGGFRAYHDYRLTLRHYTKAELTEGFKKLGGGEGNSNGKKVFLLSGQKMGRFMPPLAHLAPAALKREPEQALTIALH